MQFTLSINQKRLVEINEKLGTKLGLKHGSIIDFFIKVKNNDKFEKKIINGEEYVWLAYSKAIEELPLLNIKTKDSLARLFNDLVKTKILKKYVSKEDGNKVFWKQDTNLQFLLFENKDLEMPDVKLPEPPLPTFQSEASYFSVGTLPTFQSDNHYTTIIEPIISSPSQKENFENSKNSESEKTKNEKILERIESLKEEVKANPLYPVLVQKAEKKGLKEDEIEVELSFAIHKQLEERKSGNSFTYFQSWIENLKTRYNTKTSYQKSNIPRPQASENFDFETYRKEKEKWKPENAHLLTPEDLEAQKNMQMPF